MNKSLSKIGYIFTTTGETGGTGGLKETIPTALKEFLPQYAVRDGTKTVDVSGQITNRFNILFF